MTNPNKCEIIVVLDRSGSMESIRAEMEGGLNTFIAEQKNVPGECVFTLAQFDEFGGKLDLDWTYEAAPIATVGRVSILPRGGTPLLDALGRVITRVGERLARTPETERPGKVLVMVVTDGEENKSKEFKRETIRTMVQHQTDAYQWAFMYLGANVDAFAEAGGAGIAAASSSGFSGKQAGQALHLASSKVSMYRSAMGGQSLAALNYTDEERESIGGAVAPKTTTTVTTNTTNPTP